MMGQQQTVAGSTLRRLILALATAVVMALLVMALAVPAFARSDRVPEEPGNQANQIGTQTQQLNTDPIYDDGFGGKNNSDKAQGRLMDNIATSSHYTP
jgi:hypothetical protein